MRFFPWNNTDPDAAAYIAAVGSAGGSVSYTQQNAINDFVKSGKNDGWYSNLKRLYLPIWAVAAPNAIDIIGLTSGTWVGGVTHSAGRVQGNGTTGYFNIGVSLSTIGQTIASAWNGYLAYTDSSIGQHGAFQNGTTQSCIWAGGSGALQYDHGGFNGGAGRLTTTYTRNSIISFASIGGNYTIAQRSASGRVDTSAAKSGGAVTTIDNYFMARNNLGTAEQFSNQQFGAHWYGTGVSDAADAAFTLALKTLWETCTGLILP